jgi:hypothetical protein
VVVVVLEVLRLGWSGSAFLFAGVVRRGVVSRLFGVGGDLIGFQALHGRGAGQSGPLRWIPWMSLGDGGHLLDPQTGRWVVPGLRQYILFRDPVCYSVGVIAVVRMWWQVVGV